MKKIKTSATNPLEVTYEEWLSHPITDEEWELNHTIGSFVWRREYGGKYNDDRIILHGMDFSSDIPLFTRSLHSLFILIDECERYRSISYNSQELLSYIIRKHPINPIYLICTLIAKLAKTVTPLDERINALKVDRSKNIHDVIEGFIKTS